MSLHSMGLIHHADSSLFGKVRRRASRLVFTRPANLGPLKRPLLTIGFDDAPQSAAHLGAEILRSRRVLGTYFISTGLMGRPSHLGTYATGDEIRALHAQGFEIASHTHDHLDCGQASAREIRDNIALNIAGLRAMGLPRPETFAFPYGDVSPDAKAATYSHFKAARGLAHGLVRHGSDLNQTPAVGLEGPDALELGRHWLQAAANRPVWLNLYTHDVREDHSPWGCTPATLAALIDEALDMGFDIVTFAEGARRAGGA